MDSDSGEEEVEVIGPQEVLQHEEGQETKREDQNMDSDSGEEEVEATETDNVFNQVTALLPEAPQTDVIVNTSDKVIKKKLRRDAKKVYEIAPGENKIPDNWLRKQDFDIRAFPQLFPDGQYGFDYHREKKLSHSKYFTQRIISHDKRCAQNPSWVFVAQQAVERSAIENQINISMQKGKIALSEDGTSSIATVSDAFSILKEIPGTPSYWKNFRNEIFARMEQLGHFHFFFTLSCAEMKWPSVIASLLHNEDHNIIFQHDEWDGTGDSIFVDGMTLTQFVEEKVKNMTSFLKDEFVHITRMFDNRLKAFIKNILLTSGIEHYCYRIEFQVRGKLHCHLLF